MTRGADPASVADAEFGFELLVCRWAELAWPPAGGGTRGKGAVVVARQLGTERRRWDTVVVEADAEALAAREAFGTEPLDSDLLHVVRNAPAEWKWYRDALPHPGYPWRYVRAAVHRAAARNVLKKRKRDNRIEIRRVEPYPDWVERIVAIENKPDMNAAAATRLGDQLEHDVAEALADEVWVATRGTNQRVEPVLAADLPVEAGVLAFDFAGGVEAESGTVEWLPGGLDTTTPGEHLDAEEKQEKRLEIAERAYGRGWRSYVDSMRPDCRHFELRRSGRALVPHCGAKERPQTAAECGGACPSFEPEPPAWRTRGWPITGGPGKGIRRVLETRRARRRPSSR